METVNVAFAYYNQPKILQKWWDSIRQVKDNEIFSWTVVDDGSKIHPLIIPEDLKGIVSGLVIKDDIPWNQPGARNLAMFWSFARKRVLLDIDHIPSDIEVFCNTIPKLDLDNKIYKFNRRYVEDGKPQNVNPNQLVMSYETFQKVGGYDEDFCGHHGYDDIMFMEVAARLGIAQGIVPNVVLDSYSTWDFRNDTSIPLPIEDASVPPETLDRSNKFNGKLRAKKRSEIDYPEDLYHYIDRSRTSQLRFKWKAIS